MKDEAHHDSTDNRRAHTANSAVQAKHRTYMSFREFNQQVICTDSLTQMEQLCSYGMNFEMQNKEDVKQMIETKKEIDAIVKEKIDFIEEIEQKETEKKEEKKKAMNENIEMVSKKMIEEKEMLLKEEELLNQNEKDRNEQRKQLIDELEENIAKEMKEKYNEMIGMMNKMEEELQTDLLVFTEKDNQIHKQNEQDENQWNEKMKGILTNEMKEMEEIKQSFIQNQQQRESIQQKTITEIQTIISDLHLQIQRLQQNGQQVTNEITQRNTLFVEESKNHLKRILQTIELGIGENGIVGVLVNQM
ncbi:MAG: hypothetical protein J6A51_04440, partial [Clostridia bacterium]|nr:hypothetical protein [Clostridia bacterium]